MGHRYSLLKGFMISLLVWFPAQITAADPHSSTAVQVLYGQNLTSIQRYSDEEIRNLLHREGYQSVRIIDNNQIRFVTNDTIYVLYLHDDGDIHLYYGATGYSLSYKDINEWNRTSRLSRAYIDDEGDIALETDLLANAGLSPAMVIETINVFVQASVPRFIQFARSHHRD